MIYVLNLDAMADPTALNVSPKPYETTILIILFSDGLLEREPGYLESYRTLCSPISLNKRLAQELLRVKTVAVMKSNGQQLLICLQRLRYLFPIDYLHRTVLLKNLSHMSR